MAVNNIQFTKIEIEIAVYLFKHYKEKFNPRQLSRLLNINHAHANKLCNILEKKGLLKKEEIGNSTYFSYNYDEDFAIKFMEYILSLEEKEFPKWLVVPLHNLRKFKPYINLGIVFGSSIKTNDFNDIDVLLLYQERRKKEIKKVKEEILNSGQIIRPVRYLDLSEKDIVSNKKDNVFYNILSENLVFYNPEKYVELIRKCRR